MPACVSFVYSRASALVAVLLASGALGACPARRGADRESVRPGPPPAPPRIATPSLGQPPYGIELRLAGDPTTAEVAQVLRRDLELSGVFTPRLTGGTTAPQQLSLPGSEARPVSTRIHLRAVATATEVSVEAKVFFAARGWSEAAGTIRRRGVDMRDAAHRLGNELYRLHTDAPGPFLSRIAFVAPSAGQRASRHIFVVDFDGGAPRRVSSQGNQNILPDWSPAGDLVFTSFARGNPDLYLLVAGSRDSRPLSARPGLNTGGDFSPDGRTIALTLTTGGNQDIYLLARDGSIHRRLTHHPKIDVSPSWSADGRSIAFASQRAGIPQIFVVPTTGGPPRRLTRGGSDNQEPDWCAQPGSTQIAYTSRRRGSYEIFVVDALTGETRQVTRDGRNNQSPSWSPDCRLLVYASGRSGLHTVTADGHRRWQLFRGNARTPAWSR